MNLHLPAMSWFQWLVILLALGLLGVLAYVNVIGNPRVVRELTANPQGERAGVVMLLRLPNGRVLPVNYLREGQRVFVGADGPWWRALGRGSAPVTVTIRGETLSGRARVVFDEPGTAEIVLRYSTGSGWRPQDYDGEGRRVFTVEVAAAG